jgi:hypothetical protein
MAPFSHSEDIHDSQGHGEGSRRLGARDLRNLFVVFEMFALFAIFVVFAVFRTLPESRVQIVE